MEDDLTTLRSRLMSLSGTGLSPEQMADALESVIKLGGGVRIEIDDVRFSLIRRDGRFVLKKDEHRNSTLPPRR